MRLSIRSEVFLVVTVSLVMIFGLTMYLVVSDTTSRLKDSLNQQSKSFASLATTPVGNTFLLYQNSGTVRIKQQVDNFLSLDPDVAAISVVSSDGSQQFSSVENHQVHISSDDAAAFSPIYKYGSSGYIQEIIEPLIESSGVHRYAIVYEISSQRVEQNVADVIRLIIYIGIAVLALSVFGTAFMLNRLFLKPLRDVSRWANIISAGKYDQKIESDKHDEIGDLANSVNKMAESLKADIVKLQELDKLKSEFMMIASHNLRTPISIMRGYLDMAKETETSSELKAIINTINESVTRLHLLAEDVLTVATLEAGATPALMQTGMKNFINSLNDEMMPLATKKGVQWNYTNSLPDDLQMKISTSNLRSALASLLDNAIKFTKEGGSVSLSVTAEGNELLFKVSDTGIGIAPEEMPKLFTKFHRGTSTMTYDYEGVGLGLYLSKLIITQHGGTIAVESIQSQGTTCVAKLPLSGPTS